MADYGIFNQPLTGVLNDTMMVSKALEKVMDSIAPQYDEKEGTYSVDDIVWHNCVLYKCTTAVATAKEFDPDDWTEYVLTATS